MPPKPQARYAINPSFVWITARDGSVHATRPPIIADGQVTLCGHTYDRRDLHQDIAALTEESRTGKLTTPFRPLDRI